MSVPDVRLLPLNERAAQLLLEARPDPQQPIFCSNADWPLPARAVTVWQRRGAATDFGVWDRQYGGALLGLPRGRDELLMLLHLVGARLLPEAPLALFGLKEAGIEAAERLLREVFGSVTLLLTKYHGRVFIARAPHKDRLIDALDDWRRANAVMLLGREVSLTAYPGMFAEGKLDPATALLIDQLAGQAAPATVLDYACGTGVLALAAQQLWPKARLDLLDYDALALRAARTNVSGADYLQAESLTVCTARYDLILSNPPIHDGNKQDYSVVEKLVMDAPRYLARGGRLLLVTQQTVPVQRWAKAADVLAQDGGFKVWRIAA